MSWSVGAIGRPEAVKQALASQFEAAKRGTAYIPEEHSCVAAVELVVNGQLDSAAAEGIKAIKVDASVSSCRKSGDACPRSVQVKVGVQTFYNFVE